MNIFILVSELTLSLPQKIQQDLSCKDKIKSQAAYESPDDNAYTINFNKKNSENKNKNYMTFKGLESSSKDIFDAGYYDIGNKNTENKAFNASNHDTKSNIVREKQMEADKAKANISNKKNWNYSPLQNFLDTKYTLSNITNNNTKLTPSNDSKVNKKNSKNNFNNTLFSIFNLHDTQTYQNNNDVSSKNLSIKLEIENIDKDIKKLQKQLKNLVENP